MKIMVSVVKRVASGTECDCGDHVSAAREVMCPVDDFIPRAAI